MAFNDFGVVKPGTALYVPFHTFSGAASITMSGLAVGDIRVYKDGSTTQRSSTSGFTLLDTDGTDFDTRTGIHGFSIDLSDNTDAGFYAAGARYWIVLSSITVDSKTVTFVAATFTIGYPGAAIDTTIATLASQTSFTLTSGPAEDDALNGCTVLIHDVASAIQLKFGVVQDYTGATKTVTLDSDRNANYTAASPDNISIFSPVTQSTTWGRTVALDTNGLVTANTTQIEGADATDQINAACDTAIQDAKLDHLVAVADADDVVDDSIIAKMTSKSATADWSDFVNTTDSLQANRDLFDLDTQTEIAAGAPSDTPTFFDMVKILYWAYKNKKTVTAALITLRNSADSADLQTASISDDGTTFTKGEFGA